MSMRAKPVPAIPEETARVAKAAFARKGSIYLTIGDQIGTLFEDISFADLYAADGAPAISPSLLALVLVFAQMEDLSDRQAADAVRARMDWKYALHLALGDTGFDFSVLSDFRERLLHSEISMRMFDRVLQRLQELELLGAGRKQRTDGSYVLAATRTLSRLELIAETLRIALEALAAEQPDWLRSVAQPHWYARYSQPWNTWRLPRGQEKRQALALEIAADGLYLLQALTQSDAPDKAKWPPEVVVCQQVWTQQLELQDGKVQWRSAKKIPPGAERIVSPHDPEARGSQHGDHAWEGYAVHWTETCEDGLPHLITDVVVTPATTPDIKIIADLHDRLARRGLLPAEHLVDSGYMAGHVIVDSRRLGIRMIGPVEDDSSWQARQPNGLSSAQFKIDWAQQRVTCPQGQHSAYWSLSKSGSEQPIVEIRFRKSTCAICPVRERCTHSANGRSLKISIYQDEILARRDQQRSAAFQQEYARRAGIEGTVSATVHSHGARCARYIGLDKTHLQAVLTGMAVNLKRAAYWLMARRPSTTRHPHLWPLASVQFAT